MEQIDIEVVRRNPLRLRDSLGGNRSVVLMDGRKPFALVISLADGDDPLESGRIVSRVRAEMAIGRIRCRAAEYGLDQLTAEEIQHEINEARRSPLG